MSASLVPQSGGGHRLALAFGVPEGHDLYADSLRVEAPPGVVLTPLPPPAPTLKPDPFLGGHQAVYTAGVALAYAVAGVADAPLEIAVHYQGCSPTACFLPTSVRFRLSARPETGPPDAAPAPPPAQADSADWQGLMRDFRISGRQTGYLNPERFLAFLEDSVAGRVMDESRLERLWSRGRLWTWLAVLLVVAGGLGLNLTPCVLPLIPVHLSILGAGAAASSRRRGLLLGLVYGGAMTVAYGLLGLGVVLTGAKFGLLNSSPLFNGAIALLFAALALALFDVLVLDFSRFQTGRRLWSPSGRGLLAAWAMGTAAALLAGSCVAPILVSVLLLSADLFRRGVTLGLALPFLLGVGMGLPWPFLGAGLSFLPRPGRWMLRLKRVFGIVVLGFAVYYGLLAVRLQREREAGSRSQVTGILEAGRTEGWHRSLPEALAEARRRQQPVLVDLWASWCKSCLAMEETTFRHPRVVRRLQGFVKVKCRAENPGDPATRSLMDFLGSIGLPTYVVLQPSPAPVPTPASGSPAR